LVVWGIMLNILRKLGDFRSLKTKDEHLDNLDNLINIIKIINILNIFEKTHPHSPCYQKERLSQRQDRPASVWTKSPRMAQFR